MHMLSACSIFIINASLWKTLQATLFVLVNARFCLHIKKRLSTNMKKLRIVDFMSDIRPFFRRPEHRCQAPGTVKVQTGQ